MTERYEIYKCEICGNIVEMLHGGKGELVCCGEAMKLFSENMVDAAKEKHVPVMEKTEKGVMVKVGQIPHPMEDKHYIEWVEILSENGVCRHYLSPGDAPKVEFDCPGKILKVREYCNLHGLWAKEA